MKFGIFYEHQTPRPWNEGSELKIIQDALGHSDSRTTEIYLKTLKDERLDGEMEKLYGV